MIKKKYYIYCSRSPNFIKICGLYLQKKKIQKCENFLETQVITNYKNYIPDFCY